MNATESDFLTVKDFGPVMARLAYEGFSRPRNREIIHRLVEAGVTWPVRQPVATESTPLSGQVWVITGSFSEHSRADIKARLEALGAKVSSSVSAKTTALAAGEKAGSKLENAENLGVRVVGEKELLKILAV